MKSVKVTHAELSLPEYPVNLATILNENARRFGDYPIYQEVHKDVFVPLLWKQFQVDVI